MMMIANIAPAIRKTAVAFKEGVEISFSICFLSGVLRGVMGISGGFGSMSSCNCELLLPDDSTLVVAVARSTIGSAETAWLRARNLC
jgi:uncharacterized membrane protein YfcA